MTGWPRGLEEALEHEILFMKVLWIVYIKVTSDSVTHIIKLIEL